ncbi:hypothetical protein BDV97DRAFT_119980 [Delphinella strobiligena]|nr:hypothetical protein BDV97DRAFT_119980 [Delphinella strobiligena]
MAHPYQIVRVCNAAHFGNAGLLLAACGPKIVSVNLEDGLIISQWPAEAEMLAQDGQGTSEDEGPPGKKRKLEKPGAALPTVIKLVLSPDQTHAVAVTGDDKCIRVFEITKSGTLIELSQRSMPKRPCAILVTPDNKTIVCGDKFGDVYSLPLLPKEDSQSEALIPQDTAPAKAFTPTATNLTVHTAKNRRALESQLRQKELKARSKEPLKFEHQLLLGHVSMLTDVQHATQHVDGHPRHFIITSDRDEHIRISRGIPQAHVIERYCLGHKEFISKLCLLPESNLLMSGGGDDWLGCWDWISGELRAKVDLKASLDEIYAKHKNQDGEDSERHVAVSGLWAVRDSQDGQTILLAASEKTPALLAALASVISSGNSTAKAIELPAIPLDVTASGSTILVSYATAESSLPRLRAYKLRLANAQPTLEVDGELDERLQGINSLAIAPPPPEDSLYGIENLRKRGIEEGQEAA